MRAKGAALQLPGGVLGAAPRPLSLLTGSGGWEREGVAPRCVAIEAPAELTNPTRVTGNLDCIQCLDPQEMVRLMQQLFMELMMY